MAKTTIHRGLEKLVEAAATGGKGNAAAAGGGGRSIAVTGSDIFYGQSVEGGVQLEGADGGTFLPDPIEALGDFDLGDRVALTLWGQRPVILGRAGGFSGSDAYWALQQEDENTQDEVYAQSQVIESHDQRLGETEGLVTGLESSVEDALEVAGTAAQTATEAINTANTAVTSTTVEYAISTSRTTPPTSGWSSSVPAIPTLGEVVWMRTVVERANGVSWVSEPALLTGDPGADGDDGTDGTDGADGVSVVSIVPHYRMAATKPAQPSGASPTGWDPTQPSYVAGQSLWQSDRIELSSGQVQWTPVTIVEAFTVAANLQSTIDAGLMRVAKESDPPTPKQGLTWLVVDEPTGTKAVGLKVAAADGSSWGSYQLLAEDVLVVGPSGEVRLKDGVVTANNFTAQTFQGVNIFGATFTQVDADDPTQAQLKIADGRLYALNYRNSGDPSQPDSEFELRAGGALELRMKEYGGGGTVEVTPNSIILEKDDRRLFFDSKNVTAQVGVVVEERPWLEVLAPSANTVIVDGVSHEASGTFTTSSLTMSASGNIFTASIQSYMDALPAAPTGWVRVPMVVRGAGNSTWVTNANGQWFAAGSTSAARAITVAWQLFKDG